MNLLREIAFQNGMTLGDTFNEAIETWYESLEDAEDE